MKQIDNVLIVDNNVENSVKIIVVQKNRLIKISLAIIDKDGVNKWKRSMLMCNLNGKN